VLLLLALMLAPLLLCRLSVEVGWGLVATTLGRGRAQPVSLLLGAAHIAACMPVWNCSTCSPLLPCTALWVLKGGALSEVLPHSWALALHPPTGLGAVSTVAYCSPSHPHPTVPLLCLL